MIALYELGVLTCLACFIKMACLAGFLKWRAWRASKKGVLDVRHKMACLKLLNCSLRMCDHGALLNSRFWMRSDVFNGRQKIANTIIAIFVFVLNLRFFVWIWFFIHIYRIQKQIFWLPSINFIFHLVQTR